jgi:Peptidase family M1 domain
VLRFTDRTYDELKAVGKAASGTANADAVAALKEAQEACQKKLHWNLTARILSDVLRERTSLGLFVAFVPGKKYGSRMVYTIDPTGAPRVAPEEISLQVYEGAKAGTWTALHYESEYLTGKASSTQNNVALHIERQKLDTQLDRNGNLHGNATTTFVANVAGMRVAPFELHNALRVTKVTGPEGQALDFIQEDKPEDPDFWVVLPKALALGDRLTVTTAYEGEDALREDGGVYSLKPGASWYPSGRAVDYAQYEMTFTVPKQLDVAATGEKVSDSQQGDLRVSNWKTAVAQPSAAFLYGAIERDDVKSGKTAYVLQSYTNKAQPKWASRVENISTPSRRSDNPRTGKEMEIPKAVFSTVQLGRDALAETDAAVKLFELYFGGMPYKHLAITQEAACTPGQALPQLVYLPMCAFMEPSQRSSAGFYKEGRGYWMSVAAHEVAHQWWGDSLASNSYRDQWMSEGFPVFSAGLFLQAAGDNKGFVKYWDDWRDSLLEKSREGSRALDMGALTLAPRLAGSRPGFDVAQKLLSPKGGYVLHMVRMMMYDDKSGDQTFKAMMREFVDTYRNQAATTEDFKAAVEKRITPAMNLTRDGKMDWFFNEYVYGTALPIYNLEYSFSKQGNGVVLKMKATQSNVDDNFVMLVPLYLDLGKEKIIRVGTLNMFGNTSVEHDIPLPLNEVPKRAMLNYYNDVLAGK